MQVDRFSLAYFISSLTYGLINWITELKSICDCFQEGLLSNLEIPDYGLKLKCFKEERQKYNGFIFYECIKISTFINTYVQICTHT